ncbi:MAG: hypothetical protein COA96_01510 [SAR86 cluster bacterium]|uniref:Uncharacterized protein n=1 Tax=SAR86 cluster bacterium TaxID=2030880 RepID=A0A2A5B9Q2_9GAMM|nr:MAG: hypothetical protein COA96_01510 [SAR86 cluster bacterium]
MKNSKSALLLLIFLSLCMGVLEVLLNLQEEVLSGSTQALWSFTFVLLTILWAYYDAKKADIETPFDFGFILYIFWPVVLPWYLYRTRGIEGILMFFGLISLWVGPWLAGVVAYYYFS